MWQVLDIIWNEVESAMWDNVSLSPIGPQQVGQGKLRILPTAGIRQVLFDGFAEAQTFVQFPHQNQATVRGNPRSLEIDFQGSIKREKRTERAGFVSHP
jgi:hypothetical protein